MIFHITESIRRYMVLGKNDSRLDVKKCMCLNKRYLLSSRHYGSVLCSCNYGYVSWLLVFDLSLHEIENILRPI